MLCEVAFNEWTPNGHLRHSKFLRLREKSDTRRAQTLPWSITLPRLFWRSFRFRRGRAPAGCSRARVERSKGLGRRRSKREAV